MISKTVYFLGAGSSKVLFGLPTMQDFFKNFCVEEHNKLSRFLSQYFFNGLKSKELEEKIRGSSLNLEEVITALELSLDRLGTFGRHPEGYLIQARRDFDIFVRKTLDIDHKEEGLTMKIEEICDKTKIIFEEMSVKYENQSPDSVITLNYDLGFDNILYNYAKDYQEKLAPHTLLSRMYGLIGDKIELYRGNRPSLYFKTKNLGVYLKLHGSLDWLYCPNNACSNHKIFFANWIDSPISRDYPNDPCILCGSPLVSVIVPPTLHKSFDNFPKLGLLWNLAFRELSRADKIIIFGISFAPSDYYLRWLLRSAVANRNNEQKLKIEVIDINRDVCAEVEKITGIKPDFKGSFEEYLDGLN